MLSMMVMYALSFALPSAPCSCGMLLNPGTICMTTQHINSGRIKRDYKEEIEGGREVRRDEQDK